MVSISRIYRITDEIIKSESTMFSVLAYERHYIRRIFKETSSHITLCELYNEYSNKESNA